MDESPAHMAKSAITFVLLTAMLSGCAIFTDTIDDERANCPVGKLPGNHQPFDTAAQREMQRLMDRNTGSDTAGDTTFVRLDDQGRPLTSPRADYDSEPWACVKDERTDLTWEVKALTPFLHGMHWTYSWYEPSLVGKHEYAGKANGGKCLEGMDCDTQAYVAAVNAEKLCGHDDWRLPKAFELHTLLNQKDNCPGTCIDPRYFPNTITGSYWTASPFREFTCYAWGVDFELGSSSGAHKNTPLHVRLVRGGRLKKEWLEPDYNAENNVPAQSHK